MQKDLGAKKTHRNHLKISNVCGKKDCSRFIVGTQDMMMKKKNSGSTITVLRTVSFLHMHVYFHF